MYELEPLRTSVLAGVQLSILGPESSLRSFLLLHGLGNSLQFWAAVAPLLSARCRVVSVDIPGFGGSTAPHTFTLDTLSNGIIDATTNLFENSDELYIVGHSMGAAIALDLSGRLSLRQLRVGVALVDGALFRASELLRNPTSAHGDLSLALNLVCQFVGGSIPLGPWAAHAMAGSSLLRNAALWPFVAEPSRLNSRLLETALSGSGTPNTLRILALARSVDLATLAASSDVEVFSVRGDKDRLMNDDDIVVARSLLDLQDDIAIAGCGHWPMIERPAELAEILGSLP